MATTTYRVLAPLVQLLVPDAGGVMQFQHFYAGATVPDGVDEESLQHHLDGGLVVKEGDEKATDAFAVPAGTPLPGRPPNVPVAEAGSTAQPVPPLSDEDVKAAEAKPKAASKSTR